MQTANSLVEGHLALIEVQTVEVSPAAGPLLRHNAQVQSEVLCYTMCVTTHGHRHRASRRAALPVVSSWEGVQAPFLH